MLVVVVCRASFIIFSLLSSWPAVLYTTACRPNMLQILIQGVVYNTSECMHYCEQSQRHGMCACACIIYTYLELCRTLWYGSARREIKIGSLR